MSAKKDHDDWRWPDDGMDQDGLREALRRIPDPYNEEPAPLCYPGTRIVRPDHAITEHASFLGRQINHIGTHTHHRDGEGGFEGSQRLEANAVWMVASILRGDRDTVDGYFCGGATEANDMGMWIARQWLRQYPDPMQRGIAILCTPLRHYSIPKAAAKFDIGQSGQYDAMCSRCHLTHLFVPDPRGTGVTHVGMTDRWEMDLGELERIFRLRYDEGFRRFMVVPTVGTTTMGSIDPVRAIGEFVGTVHRTTTARCFVHVDAAFGGFTVPFVAPDEQIGFSIPEVMSIAVDADKMGQLPYPAGIFLCRKDLQKHIERQVSYIRGHVDDTLSGSRSAGPSVFAWYQFQRDGRSGQRAYVEACINARDYLRDQLLRHEWVRVHTCSPYVNILPVELPISDLIGSEPRGDVPEQLRETGILTPYHLRADYVPNDSKDPESCPRIIYKLCVMPHTFQSKDGAKDYRRLDRFIEDLERARKEWRQRNGVV